MACVASIIKESSTISTATCSGTVLAKPAVVYTRKSKHGWDKNFCELRKVLAVSAKF